MLSVLMENFFNFLCQLLPADKSGLNIDTLRLWFFKTAGKVAYNRWRIYLKLNRHHVHKNYSMNYVKQGQAIKW